MDNQYIEREVKEKFERISSIYNLVALVGPRQTGKTTFLKKLLSGPDSSYISLDDPDARELFDADIKKFENQYIKDYKIIIIDEVQYGKDAGLKLKYLADKHKNKKIWITSSSQIILSKEVLSWLVGRVSVINIYPFSLNEFLISKNQKEITPTILQRNITEHVIYGGYPKVVLTEEREAKKTLLKDLSETMILKDMAKTFSIEDVSSLEKTSRYLSNFIGNVIIYENISREIGISFQTIKKYLDAMEKSYLIIRLQPFFNNKLSEVIKHPKLYFVDTGMRSAIANQFPISLEKEGPLFENYILNEILKMGFTVKYWLTKSKAEVDFVIEKDNEIIPVEVKITPTVGKVAVSFRSFIERYKPKRGFIVYYKGEHQEVEVNGCKVLFTDILGLQKVLIKSSE
ncbi:ATP-binding protein [Candidatus Micrarchaeota archaeon]|nr:ATP-binding protein [Candidatus Micrarchaeota archaeon]